MTDKTKKRTPRLGRGLSSLIANPVHVHPHPQEAAQTAEKADAGSHAAAATIAPAEGESQRQGETDLQYVPIDAIRPNPHQPRQHFDQTSLDSLAASIRSDGLMQPIVLAPPATGSGPGSDVTPHINAVPSSYQIVAGERRWRAAKLAGLKQIPAVVRELDERTATEWALIENLQREDLNPIERAEAFKHLLDQYQLSHEQIAQRVGLERATITNLLRLLNLSESVRELVRRQLLSMGQARAIAGLNQVQAQEALAGRAVREGLSVRQVEKLARSLAGEAPEAAGRLPKSSPSGKSAYYRDLERQLSEQLGTKVHLNPGRKKGSGKLTIAFYSLDQFDAIMTRLGIEVS